MAVFQRLKLVYDQNMDTIFDILSAHLDDPATGWSIGTFGAIAEFHRDANEAAEIDLSPDHGQVRTARGAISILRDPAARLIPYETISTLPSAWGQGVMVCLPNDTAALTARKGVASLGADNDTLMPASGEHLYDLGFGFSHIEACVRIADPGLRDALANASGTPFLELPIPLIQVLKATNPVRVFRSRLGRIEVAQEIPDSDGVTPLGPHTHVLPNLLNQEREQAANIPIPNGWTIALAFYPPHPMRTTDGSHRPLDKITFNAFQTLIQDYAPADLAAAKRTAWKFLDTNVSAAPEAVPTTRHARTAFRVALRQWEHLHGVSTASIAWRQLCDPTGQPAEADIRPRHEADT